MKIEKDPKQDRANSPRKQEKARKRENPGQGESPKNRENLKKPEKAKVRENPGRREKLKEQERPGKGKRPEKTARASGYQCPAQKRCGGCRFLYLPYEEQLAFKQRQVEKLLGSYCRVHRITGMEAPLHYRNKVHAAFAHRRDGTVVSGIYEEGTHRVVPVDECLLENQKADEIIRTIRGLLKSFKIRIYDEDSGYGLLRHVLVRTARQTGQVMVVLVLRSPILPSKNNFVKALRAAHPEITTIVLNVNDRRTSMVLGEKETVLYGKGYIEDELCGRRFRISARSFYQVNSVQTEALYAKAIELAGLSGRERVIDAYCGIGTIGLIAEKKAGEVIGVELNHDAVQDAIRNANDVKNIHFYENDAGRFMVGMAEQDEHADVVFMDPPRAGSDEAFLSSVVRLAPERVVYISCNPETQARDLAYLAKHGYRAQGAWPYDMFPFTDHVETVCLLSNRKPDTKVRIDVDLEDYYHIKDKKKQN